MRARRETEAAGERAFTAGTALFVIHLGDHVATGEAVATLIAPGAFGLFCIVVAVGFTSLPPPVRLAVTAFCAVVLAYGTVVHHVGPALSRGLVATDITGFAAFAGAALMAVAPLTKKLTNRLDVATTGGV